MHYAPCFVILRGLSTLYRCSLTTVAQARTFKFPWAQDKQHHEKPLIRDCCNHKGRCTLNQTIFNHRSQDQLLEFRMSFYETISSEFLVQRNFKHTQFSREHWHWRDSNSQPLAPKASAVSIELTWLLKYFVAPVLRGKLSFTASKTTTKVVPLKYFRVVEWVALIRFLFGVCHY